jgi:hypothetical protein
LPKPKPPPITITNNSSASTESAHLIAEINSCPYYYVNRIAVPNTFSTSLPPPVVVQTVPASLTTTQLINSTVLSSVTNRFQEFFPKQILPPQFLQINYYRINYEPLPPQSPCNGFRSFPA